MNAPPPQWLALFADSLATTIVGFDLLAPIGCHYYYDENSGVWEITLFASFTEIVGGAKDGLQTSSGFAVDLKSVVEKFDRVDRMHWQAVPFGEFDPLGPHASVEGAHEGHDVWVRICAKSPEQFGNGRIANTFSQRIEELW